MKFKNPQNGHFEKVSALISSWLWGWQNTIWAKGAHSRWMVAGLE